VRAIGGDQHLSYTGPLELLADPDAVIHHIAVCSYPIGLAMLRCAFARREGDLLALSTKPMIFQGSDTLSRARVGACRPRLSFEAVFSYP
jgi:hypothetical protein